MEPDLLEFKVALQQSVHAALHYLNARTPHRYTGIWRYEGELLRNEALYDRSNPTLRKARMHR